MNVLIYFFCVRIHTCLEEAENERMHLMYELFLSSLRQARFLIVSNRTFMTLRRPSIFFRALVLGTQGVFYNLFCNPHYVLLIHRFDSCFASSFILYDISKDLPSFCGASGGRGRPHLVGLKIKFCSRP